MVRGKSKLKVVFALILFLVLSYFYQDELVIAKNSVLDNVGIQASNNSSFSLSNSNIVYNLRENMSDDIDVVFCPSDACFELLNDSLSKANSKIKCAFYEFDDMNLSNTLILKAKEEVNVSIIVDDAYLNESPLVALKGHGILVYSDENRGTRYNNYMHDKFCVIDDRILITGSMNPTLNGIYRNNNNLIRMESKYLSRNYEREFDQMALNVFGTNKKPSLEYNNVSLNRFEDEVVISSYMCPQDECEREVVNILDMAKGEIVFATFAFTDMKIADKLIQKSSDGLNVSGIIESRNRNLKGSVFGSLNESFDMYLDTNKYNMHHKFFVVDGRYVVTGSMNPTGSGVDYNDENILIIDSKKIASLYKTEFERLIEWNNE